MPQNPNFTFRRGDLLAIALVVVLASAVFTAFLPRSSAPENSIVQILQDSQPVRELPLNTDAEAEINGEYTNIIRIEDGRVSIAASDCPGEDCVHSGWISDPGRSIVCLPNRVEVRITGTSDVDFVVG